MRIAFAGVSSTGKTTLSTAIAKDLDLPQVHEPLEEAFDWCRENKLYIPVEDCRVFTQRDKVRFEKGIFASVDMLERLHARCGFVADSARYVHMMYMLYFCAGNQTVVQTEEMYEWFMKEAGNYDAVFYLPFGVIPIVDDDRRLTDRYLLQGMDGVLRSIIEDAKRRGHRVFTVHNRQLDSRIAFVKNVLKYDLKLL